MKLTKALRYTLIFAIVGIVTTVIVVYVQQRILNAYRNNAPYINLSDFVKTHSAKAHLAFEKFLAGDQTVTLQRDVTSSLLAAKQVLQGAYDGKQTALGLFPVIDNEEIKVILKEAIIDIDNLNSAAIQRWEERKDSGSESTLASEADRAFTVMYERSQRSMDRLAAHVKERASADEKNLKRLSWLSTLVVVLTFVSLCTLVYKRQRTNDKNEAENTAKLDEETKRVSALSQFIEAVSAGNYNIELQGDSRHDSLTTMLINMRDNLKRNAEDDRRRNWTTTGLAQVGELLRATTSNTSELYDNIVRFLVKYTKSNQGGLFILDDDNENDPHLQLVACYAFERKKYLKKRVDIGDGLIGQCFQEGQRIFLKQVPESYVSITSGLGGSNPNTLLLVPMKANDRTYGVIELASFTKYEEYEIELVEKLAESIAATISSVKVNETTRTLLERTQQQAEEMKSQEEEIRQNMEELEATQEEMRRKQVVLEQELEQSQQQAESLRAQEKKVKESQTTLQAIVDNIPRAIFWKDPELRFMGCNKIFASIAGLSSPQELIGKSDFDMVWSAQADAYRKDDMEVIRSKKGKFDIEEVNINSEGKESWILTSKVPIVGENNNVVAILGMFEDITGRKQKEADIAHKLQERETALQELAQLKQTLEQRKG